MTDLVQLALVSLISYGLGVLTRAAHTQRTIKELRKLNSDKAQELAQARKNDARDPDTGRYIAS